jgi:hypothetical protein
MAIVRVDRTVQTAQGQAISGAQFYVLTQPANVTALTPLASVYSDLSGTPAANPQITDGLGQVGFYLQNTQLYTFVIVSPLIDTQSYPDQSLGSSSSGTTYTPVAEVPGGTPNGVLTTFTLSYTPAAGSLVLTVNNLPQTPGLQYTLAANVITFAVAPLGGFNLYAYYWH